MTEVILSGSPEEIKEQARELLGLDCPIRKVTNKQIAGSNIIDKLAAHIERDSFDYVSKDELKDFINHCHDGGSISFQTLRIKGASIRVMNFTPRAGSVSSDFVK